MRKLPAVSLALAVLILGVQFTSPTTSGKNAKFIKSQNPIRGQYIVVLDRPSNEFRHDFGVEASAYELAGNYRAGIKHVFSAAMKGFTARMTEEDAEALSKDPRVLFVEEDAVVSVNDWQTNPSWALDRIDQRNLPLNSNYYYTQTGSGVHAYILDTGIRVTHSDFGGRASVSFDAIGDGQNGNDCHGHGTHVAGLVGGNTFGVAKTVSLHSVRVLPCNGQGAVSQLMAGIDWVTANRVLPAVANISIGVSGISGALDSSISNSIASGVTYVVAAGNNSIDACTVSPSRVPNAITVGATSDQDRYASFSNYGSCLDIFAPGYNVLSASHVDDTATRYMSGTSMASPIVAGVAALYLRSNPTASPAMVTTNVKNLATSNMIAGLDTSSPNKLVYSLLAPTAANASIEGSVKNAKGGGIRGAVVTLTNATTGEQQVAISSSFGAFRFSDLPVNDFYVISVSAKSYTFSNPTASFVLNDNVTGLVFTARR